MATTTEETPVQTAVNEDNARPGQAQQATPFPEPHDGTHVFSEVRVETDRVITDVNHPLAVQVPEGVGASSVGALTPLSVALRVGTPESQFEAAQRDDTEAEEAPTGAQTAQGPSADEGKPEQK